MFALLVRILAAPKGRMFDCKFVRVDRRNLQGNLFVALHLMFLVNFSSLLACAADPVILASKVRTLLGPFHHFNIPTRRLTVVVAVTLHFVPALLRRASQVVGTRSSHNTSFADKGL